VKFGGGVYNITESIFTKRYLNWRKFGKTGLVFAVLSRVSLQEKTKINSAKLQKLQNIAHTP
jgi:hypothetical protein